jgi:hypothetical protein
MDFEENNNNLLYIYIYIFLGLRIIILMEYTTNDISKLDIK